MDLEQYVKGTDKAEKEIEDLIKTIKTLLSNKPTPESQEVLEKLVNLRAENTKLKCGLEIQSQKMKAKAEKARYVNIFFFNDLTQYDMLDWPNYGRMIDG